VEDVGGDGDGLAGFVVCWQRLLEHGRLLGWQFVKDWLSRWGGGQAQAGESIVCAAVRRRHDGELLCSWWILGSGFGQDEGFGRLVIGTERQCVCR
jgi:hypothetical protein